MSDEAVGLLASLLGLVLIVALGMWLSSITCHRKWEGTGFMSQWGVFQGCRISKDGKTWTPEENYREIP